MKPVTGAELENVVQRLRAIGGVYDYVAAAVKYQNSKGE